MIFYILPCSLPIKYPPVWPVLVLQRASHVWVSQDTQPLALATQRPSLIQKRDVKVSDSVLIQILGCGSKSWQKRHGETPMWNNITFAGGDEVNSFCTPVILFSKENVLLGGLTCVISLFRAYFSCVLLHVFTKTHHSITVLRGCSCSPSATVLTG